MKHKSYIFIAFSKFSVTGFSMNIKRFWGIVCFPFIYLALQFVISGIYSVAMMLLTMLENLETIQNMTTDEMTALFLSRINIMVPLAISIVVMFIIMFILLRKEWAESNFWSGTGFISIMLCFALGIGMNFFLSALLNITSIPDLFPEYESIMSQIIGNNVLAEAIIAAILTPVLEEIIFRGVVFKRLRENMDIMPALLLQALFFGFIHLNVLQGAYAFILGIILGLAYIWTDSIWSAVAVHITFNLTSVLLSGIGQDTQVDDTSSIALTIVLLSGAAISAITLTILAKRKIPSN